MENPSVRKQIHGKEMLRLSFSLMFRLMPRLPDSPEYLDFGFIRKMMYSQRYRIDPNCITHYLSGAQLGKDNL